MALDVECQVLEQGHKAHLDRCIKSGRPRRDALADAGDSATDAEGDEEEEQDAEELQRIYETKVQLLPSASFA